MVLNGIKWVKSYPVRTAVPICFKVSVKDLEYWESMK